MNRTVAGVWLFSLAAVSATVQAGEQGDVSQQVGSRRIRDIKAYCIDFNWGDGGPNGFARPGLWADADPGDGKLSKEKEIAYSRKAIDRTWKTIRTAAKEASPECIIWLTAFNPTHPHIVNSRMYREVDWLMNEGGDLERIQAITPMIGTHTRLITCLANWNGQNAVTTVPAASGESPLGIRYEDSGPRWERFVARDGAGHVIALLIEKGECP